MIKFMLLVYLIIGFISCILLTNLIYNNRDAMKILIDAVEEFQKDVGLSEKTAYIILTVFFVLAWPYFIWCYIR